VKRKAKRMPTENDAALIDKADETGRRIRNLEKKIAELGYGPAPVPYMGEEIFAVKGRRVRIMQGTDSDYQPIGDLPMEARVAAWEALFDRLGDNWREWAMESEGA
jgi:hypothetical protein